MFIWPQALILLMCRASLLMNWPKKKVPHSSSDGTSTVLLLFYCFPPLMSERESNYKRRPSGFISVTHFNRWVLLLFIRLGPESAYLMRKLSSQEPFVYQQERDSVNYNILPNNALWDNDNHHFLFLSFFFQTSFKNTLLQFYCLPQSNWCVERKFCVCWQRENFGRMGGKPTVPFKYTQHWVTPVWVGVDLVDSN